MIIELLDGTRFDIADYSLKRLFHYIPSANIVHSNYELQGRPDLIVNSRLNNRVIRVEMLYITQDIYDYYLLRDELNALFMREEEFYIIFKREPYKRWLVKINAGYEIPPNPDMQSFTIEFITQKGYAESIGTSQTIKEWDVDLWAWNGVIDWDSDSSYSFNTNSFSVLNSGNVKVDPRSALLDITLSGVFSSEVKITNTTNGDEYIYYGPLSSSDELKITGIRSLKNGDSVFSNTNKELISLEVGENLFEITGGIVSNISFDFRYLFK